jgi:RNA polymerase sigma-70 factor (ECF subfamily)
MAGATGTTERGSLFVTTRWSVVLAAQDKARPDSTAALDVLCRAYWYPLYAFVRRQGRNPDDAQDLTQAFFAKLLEKDYLRAAAPEKGRFRTFLLVALKRFLANEWDRARRLKRGGGLTPLPLDTAIAERRYQVEPPADLLPADRVFERRWAMTLLEGTLDRLRAEYAAAGKEPEFESLKECLTAVRGEIPYGPLAAGLGLSEGATRVAVHRLRKRFRETFRAAVADTVSDPAEVDDELRHVAAVLSRA